MVRALLKVTQLVSIRLGTEQKLQGTAKHILLTAVFEVFPHSGPYRLGYGLLQGLLPDVQRQAILLSPTFPPRQIHQ